MRGGMGLRLDSLKTDHVTWLQKRLTVESIPFGDNEPQVVTAYHVSDGYLWIPRFFDWMSFWPKIKPAGWQWVCPVLDYDLQSRFKADPERRQPEAIVKIVEHLRQHSGGIGVLPTGIGKTFLSLEIGRQFQTPICVLVHKGDMIDNWIEHAYTHLGVPAHDVALIKENSYAEDKPVTICSVQTLLARDFPPSFYAQFGFVVADEVHHYGASQWSKVISRFPARYRLGVSADPIRDDGLDPIVRWNFGKVAFGVYRKNADQLPLVCMIRYPGHYEERKYHDWRQIGGEWQMVRANAMKYAKLLAQDKQRNSWLVDKIIEARSKGRRILVFAKLRDHVEALHDEFIARWSKAMEGIDESSRPKTKIAKLWGGLKDRDRHAAMSADVTFTTYGFSKEATNLPQKDTLILATPAGDPLQTIGRLRDKGHADRKSFLAIDPFEGNDYSFERALKRAQAYSALGIEVQRYAKK